MAEVTPTDQRLSPRSSFRRRLGRAKDAAAPAGAVPPPGVGARETVIRREPNAIKRALLVLGPGLVTGASDDDPSGIGTYAVAGASLGFATLWTTLVTIPLMITVQFISAKIGLVTGMGLAGVLRGHYPRSLLYAAVLGLAVANTINAGADIGAIAATIHLLAPIPAGGLIVPVVLLILALQIWGSYRMISRAFKWMTLALFAYIGAAFYARPGLAEVLRGTFVPAIHLNRQFLSVLVALLGTTISPYMWFWQASQEVEEQVAIGHKSLRQRKGSSDAELACAAWDIDAGMLLSNLVAYFVILATAATLFKAGKTDIKSAADAALALRPLAGDAARPLRRGDDRCGLPRCADPERLGRVCRGGGLRVEVRARSKSLPGEGILRRHRRFDVDRHAH